MGLNVEYCPWVLMWNTRYFCQMLYKPEFSRHTFKKNSNDEFNANPPNGGLSCSMATDGWIDIRKLIVTFWKFCECT